MTLKVYAQWYHLTRGKKTLARLISSILFLLNFLLLFKKFFNLKFYLETCCYKCMYSLLITYKEEPDEKAMIVRDGCMQFTVCNAPRGDGKWGFDRLCHKLVSSPFYIRLTSTWTLSFLVDLCARVLFWKSIHTYKMQIHLIRTQVFFSLTICNW